MPKPAKSHFSVDLEGLPRDVQKKLRFSQLYGRKLSQEELSAIIRHGLTKFHTIPGLPRAFVSQYSKFHQRHNKSTELNVIKDRESPGRFSYVIDEPFMPMIDNNGMAAPQPVKNFLVQSGNFDYKKFEKALSKLDDMKMLTQYEEAENLLNNPSEKDHD